MFVFQFSCFCGLFKVFRGHKQFVNFFTGSVVFYGSLVVHRSTPCSAPSLAPVPARQACPSPSSLFYGFAPLFPLKFGTRDRQKSLRFRSYFCFGSAKPATPLKTFNRVPEGACQTALIIHFSNRPAPSSAARALSCSGFSRSLALIRAPFSSMRARTPGVFPVLLLISSLLRLFPG